MKHTIVLKPGDSLEVDLVEQLPNGYPDHVGGLSIFWQERTPTEGIAGKRRELQVDSRAYRGKVGPVVVTHT
jgi:hypothetical protein